MQGIDEFAQYLKNAQSTGRALSVFVSAEPGSGRTSFLEQFVSAMSTSADSVVPASRLTKHAHATGLAESVLVDDFDKLSASEIMPAMRAVHYIAHTRGRTVVAAADCFTVRDTVKCATGTNYSTGAFDGFFDLEVQMPRHTFDLSEELSAFPALSADLDLSEKSSNRAVLEQVLSALPIKSFRKAMRTLELAIGDLSRSLLWSDKKDRPAAILREYAILTAASVCSSPRWFAGADVPYAASTIGDMFPYDDDPELSTYAQALMTCASTDAFSQALPAATDNSAEPLKYEQFEYAMLSCIADKDVISEIWQKRLQMISELSQADPKLGFVNDTMKGPGFAAGEFTDALRIEI